MDGVEFVFIDKINTLKSFLIGAKHNWPIIETTVKKADACIVHVFSMHAADVIKAARKYSKPVCNVVVGCPWQAYWNYNLYGKFLAPINYMILRRLQQQASHSIYVTNYFLQNRYPTRGVSTNCSNVQISSGDPEVLRKRLLKISLTNSSVLKIGTMAAVDVPYKGQRYVIEAMSLLKKKGSLRFEYHVAGAGDITALENLANELGVTNSVIFHGAIPHEEVTDFLDSIDIYIQPSKQEGLPRALIEAMSRGCLCMGSKIAGIPELLSNKYLFKKGKNAQIASILETINTSSLREQAKANFEEAKKYDSKIINNRRNKFLTKFLLQIK